MAPLISVKSSLFKDSFWSLLGNVFGKGLALIASVFIARMLGKDVFGMYGLIRTTLLGVAVFSTFGLGLTATKFIAEYIQNKNGKLKLIIRNIMQITLATGLIFSFLIFIFSEQIANYLEAPALYNAIRYLAVIVIFNSIVTTQSGILAGFKKFKALARINLINGVFLFFGSVLLTYYWGLNGALLSLLLSQILNCLQNFIEVRKSVKEVGVLSSTYERSSIKKELITFSLPIALQEMLYSILTWITPVLLVKYSNFGEVGLYNAAQQWSSVILFIPGTLRNVILAHVSADSTKPDQQVKTLQSMMIINFLATFVPFIIVFVFSGFIQEFYGPTFSSLKAVLNILVFTTIFSCLSNVFKQYFMAVNKAWLTLWFRMGNSLLMILLFIIIMKYNSTLSSSLGMAYAMVITQVLAFVVLYLVFRKLEINRQALK